MNFFGMASACMRGEGLNSMCYTTQCIPDPETNKNDHRFRATVNFPKFSCIAINHQSKLSVESTQWWEDLSLAVLLSPLPQPNTPTDHNKLPCWLIRSLITRSRWPTRLLGRVPF